MFCCAELGLGWIGGWLLISVKLRFCFIETQPHSETSLKLMLSGSLLFSLAALFCFSAGEAVEQELQYILRQALRGGGVEFGEAGVAHEAVHLADE